MQLLMSIVCASGLTSLALYEYGSEEYRKISNSLSAIRNINLIEEKAGKPIGDLVEDLRQKCTGVAEKRARERVSSMIAHGERLTGRASKADFSAEFEKIKEYNFTKCKIAEDTYSVSEFWYAQTADDYQKRMIDNIVDLLVNSLFFIVAVIFFSYGAGIVIVRHLPTWIIVTLQGIKRAFKTFVGWITAPEK